MQTGTAATIPEEKTCLRCHTILSPGQDHEIAPEGVFCRPCFQVRQSERDRGMREEAQDINYPAALLGALLGGTAGVVAWWGVTVLSNIAFGAVAILIGVAVAKGATLMTGNKRSRSLQVMCLTVAGVAFFYATYLVNRTFIQQALAREGKEAMLSILPDPTLFLRVITIHFDPFNLLFLGIVFWEAWKFTAPLKTR
jgi:hypothetical protein